MHHAPVKMGDAELGREVSAGASPSLVLEAHPTSQVADAMGQLGVEVCPWPAPAQAGRPKESMGPRGSPRAHSASRTPEMPRMSHLADKGMGWRVAAAC